MATLTIADLDNGKRDLQTVDEVANSTGETATTRFGQQVPTLWAALRAIGYQAPVNYSEGLSISSGLQTVYKSGVVYAPLVEKIPFTTAAWDPSFWRPAQDAGLLQSHIVSPDPHPQLTASINSAVSDAENARDAAIAAAGPLYATEAEGRAAVGDGDTFNVQGSGDVAASVYRRINSTTSTLLAQYPAASAVTGLDALKVNSGKAFPLRSMSRGGVSSPANANFNNFLLDVRVLGAKKGKLYRVAYFQNGATLDGEAANDWIIEEHDAATYVSEGNSPLNIISYQKTTHGEQQQVDRSGGVQTVVLTSLLYPEYQVAITLDAAKLPAAGLAVNAIASGSQAYSWIVDTSAYDYNAIAAAKVTSDAIAAYKSGTDSLRVNQGRPMPFAAVSRDGVTSASVPFQINSGLDIKVIGARPGKVYRLEWYGNGTAAFGAARYDMLFAEYDAATYATDSATGRLDLITLVDLPNTTPPDAGVVTRRFDSPRVPGLSFVVTYDTSVLTPGTAIPMNNVGRPGFSWIIDPSCYIPTRSVGEIRAGVLWQRLASGNVLVSWASTNDCYRVEVGPNGANALPNIIAIDRAAGNRLESALWSRINTAATDWLPPLVFNSLEGDAGASANQFTGGNHLIDGAVTAAARIFTVCADGRPVNDGEFGWAHEVRIVIVNDLMAANTVALGRYAARQAFNVTFKAGSVSVDADIRALENVKFSRDYGLQAVTLGFQGTQLVLGGQNTQREAFDSTKTSGQKVDYPNAWGIVLQSTNGQLGMWMDKDYRVGSGELVDANEPLLQGGGAGNTKWYMAALISAAGVTRVQGAGYRYRGGYTLGSVVAQPAGFDSTMPVARGGYVTEAYVLADGDSCII